jgi:hypothetical protein
VVLTKYLPLDRQKEVVRECYELSAGADSDWHTVLPYTISMLAVPDWKVSY